MDWLTLGVQWTHILLGILWFGNSLVLDVFTIPALSRLPIVEQREFGRDYGRRTIRFFDVAVRAVAGPMPSLGVLTQAWTAAEAALPLGWRP
jgi:hypothetical protein